MGQTTEGNILRFCNREGISFEYYKSQVLNNLKWRYKCRQWQSKDDFSIDKSRWDGKKAKCVYCDRIKVKKCRKGSVSYFKGKTHTEETKDLLRAINTGSGNPNWKGGRTKLIQSIRNSEKYKEWRKSIYALGCYACSNCGVKKSGNNIILDADHIKSIANILEDNKIFSIKEAMECDELFDTANGRCLCRKCHIETPTWGTNRFKYKKQ